MRVLGLDVGEKRIGLAFCDTESGVAVPAGVIHRAGTPDDLDAVVTQATSRGVDLLVVGMPWSLNGRAGPQAQLVAAFIEALQQRTSLPVTEWDERFTSVEADRRLREAASQPRSGGRRKSQSKPPPGTQDAMAAAIMLQAYLDAQDHVLQPLENEKGESREL